MPAVVSRSTTRSAVEGLTSRAVASLARLDGPRLHNRGLRPEPAAGAARPAAGGVLLGAILPAVPQLCGVVSVPYFPNTTVTGAWSLHLDGWSTARSTTADLARAARPGVAIW